MPRAVESWRRRRAVIGRVLLEQVVHNQDELRRRLLRLGFRVTQASVSRDLAEMGVAKVDGRYVPARVLAAGARRATALREVASFVAGCAVAGPHLLVVKTPPGLAPSVALALDDAGWPEVVGTLAGDDTLFVATAGRRQQARVEARLGALKGREAADA